ncbi:MAG: protein-L-isoaspartate O-methyltransferase [Methanobacteriota archaeon]|nr:MAG: protein-L-isoaspartate O-methyltransferase [Euryarchaeota archaeon]
MELDSMERSRDMLVDRLVRRGYIVSSVVEEAMRRVPREEFVPERLRSEAYVDTPLPIGTGQTISAPHMVAIMVEKLDLKSGQKVLEVGAGSGYHAAVVAEAVSPDGHVYTIERIEPLARFAEGNLRRTGYKDTVTVIIGDGSKGLAEHAPFDRIFVACSAPDVPAPLLEQLADGGKMLVPVGSRAYQDLICVERRGHQLLKENYGGCVFVPLIGEFGY